MASPDPALIGAPDDALLRWRLVIGESGGVLAAAGDAVAADDRLAAVDRSLDFLYGDGPRGAGLEGSLPYVPTWLGDIRRAFPRDVVVFLQREAMERRGLRRLLLEPETLATLERDISLAATLVGLKGVMPDETRQTARMVISEVVEELRRRLEPTIRQAVTGAIQRNRHSPLRVARNLDVNRTIRDGLRHYSPELEAIVPERVYFYANQQRHHEWRIVVLVDQSGSMAESVIYSAVFAAVFASLPALDTRLVLFDTSVVDLSEELSDPVELLFGVQLGGGTDIAHALTYASGLIEQPEKTIFLLISDLYEGGSRESTLRQLAALRESKVKALCVLALNDRGVASYDGDLARKVAALDIPTFAATPGKLVDAVERALRGETAGVDGD